MRERPILFSAPMVRAILDGRKTQDRRLVKPQPPAGHSWHGFTISSTRAADEGKAAWARGEAPHLVGAHRVRCPYGQAGDRLWVRESFKAIISGEVKDGYGELRYGFAYQADNATRWQEQPTIIHDLTGQPPSGPMQFKPVPWKPSIHMPRRASRITLEVTGVRVERLQDISEADAQAEGVTPAMAICDDDGVTHRDAFGDLWESINGAGSWDADPWVWVIEFQRAAQRREVSGG